MHRLRIKYSAAGRFKTCPYKAIQCGILILLLLCIGVTANAKKKITQPTNRAVYHNNQGIIFLGQENFDRALTEFQTAVELSPHYVEAFNNLGLVQKLQGKFGEAITNFETAIKLDKNYAPAYVHLGTIYLDQGNPKEAVSIIKKGIKKDRTLSDGFYNLGLAYLALAKKDDKQKNEALAEKALKRATELDPNLTHVHEVLAHLYESQGRFDLAAIRFRLALGNSPQSDKDWVELGKLYLSRHDSTKAIAAFNAALQINPYSADAHNLLGDYYMNEGRVDDAINEYKSVTVFMQQDANAWFKLGSAYLETADAISDQNPKLASQRYEGAITALSKAKDVKPNFAEASYNLGLAYLKLGKTAEAISEWEYTIVVNPRYSRAYYNLGNAYKASGDMKKSARAFCKFIDIAKDEFPSEVEVARQEIQESGQKCSK
ncbi:MAG: tetratricopeptide repeat protein [Pseudomonadota bacterium]